MPDPTAHITVPAGVWTQAAEGPCEALVTGTDNFDFVYADAQPVDATFGHHRFARADLVAKLPAEMSLWVYSPLRAFRIAVTVEPD